MGTRIIDTPRINLTGGAGSERKWPCCLHSIFYLLTYAVHFGIDFSWRCVYYSRSLKWHNGIRKQQGWMNKVKRFVTYVPMQLLSFTITEHGNNLSQSGELWKMGLHLSFSVAEFPSCLLILTVILKYSSILSDNFEILVGGLFLKMGQKTKVSLFIFWRGWPTDVIFFN